MSGGPDQSGTLLDVRGLRTYFFTRAGVVKAVDDVSFRIEAGEVLGLVGESGCGKSVTSLSLMRVVPPPGRIVGGGVLFKGRDRLAVDETCVTRLTCCRAPSPGCVSAPAPISAWSSRSRPAP